MSLILQAQNDLAAALLSEAAFAKIAVATYRSMVTSQEIAKKLPHVAGRQPVIPGPIYKGCGIIVNMPTRRGILANVTPPQSWWIYSFDVVEQPEINFLIHGTKMTCEEVSEAVITKFNNFQIEGLGLLQVSDESIAPVPGLAEIYPGCAGYRVSVETRASQSNEDKSTLPIPSHDHGQLFFNEADPGAAIYYTVDGSFPGPGNAAALLYDLNNPPNVGAGVTVRYAAYTPGSLGSDAGQAITN